MTGLIEVEVTCPDEESARKIACAALQARLVACASMLPGVESLFHWQGQIDSETEVLVRMKATASRFDELCDVIVAHHPYALPAITALPLAAIGPGVANWIATECQVAKT